MLLANLLVYFPFRNKMDIVYRNYDGPFYMYLAKTLYSIPEDPKFDDPLDKTYYASHLPAYPVLIRAMTLFTGGNYPIAMILASALSSIGAAILFYNLLKAWNLVACPFWTSVLFCFFPPRWLIYHTVGATEPLLLFFSFAAFLALRRKNTWLVALCILFASLTRIMGILLLPVFFTIYVLRKETKAIPVLLLSVLGLFGLFLFYHFEFGDFFAYFRHNLYQKGMINPYPFEAFRLYASKINFHTSELYLLLYAIYGMGTILLWKHKEFFVYSFVFFVFACFIYHFDLPRHMIPLAPFAILVAFDSHLSRIAFKILLAPLLIYLTYAYVWGWLPYPLLPEEAYKNLLMELQK